MTGCGATNRWERDLSMSEEKTQNEAMCTAQETADRVRELAEEAAMGIRALGDLMSLAFQMKCVKACKKFSKESTKEVVEAPDEILEYFPEWANDNGLCKSWHKLIEQWTSAFPAVNVMIELQRAYAWEIANPKNKKTRHARFLNMWMSRAQDKASRAQPFQNREKGSLFLGGGK